MEVLRQNDVSYYANTTTGDYHNTKCNGDAMEKHSLKTFEAERLEIVPGIDGDYIEVWVYGRYNAVVALLGYKKREFAEFLRQVLTDLDGDSATKKE